MKTTVLALAAGLAVAMGAGPAAAQSGQGTHYYCYAWTDGYGRVYVTDSVRYAANTDLSQAVQAFVNTVRATYGVSTILASGCRPPNATPDRDGVENERNVFIQQERANGKNVVVTRW
ncbi:hypothetical protein [Phenylobacterium sp.]|uniref:hypothetical protein n=1 Tax=Phenylobacterium sp. TaxID=1871053 RepID=UPI0025EE9063|nr:hypothetical protein [Phenylobacterium sp.]MBX3484626.1 hypothetical protein [Phenylobacterium sp.]MCW5759179.1 hypothetical protein [Phenylobacterium sp.]